MAIDAVRHAYRNSSGKTQKSIVKFNISKNRLVSYRNNEYPLNHFEVITSYFGYFVAKDDVVPSKYCIIVYRILMEINS